LFPLCHSQTCFDEYVTFKVKRCTYITVKLVLFIDCIWCVYVHVLQQGSHDSVLHVLKQINFIVMLSFASFPEVYLFKVSYPVMAKCDHLIALQLAKVNYLGALRI